MERLGSRNVTVLDVQTPELRCVRDVALTGVNFLRKPRGSFCFV